MGMLLARALDDPGDVPGPRDEHEMPGGQFGHARIHPLRHEALELRIDCAILCRDDVPRRHDLQAGATVSGSPSALPAIGFCAVANARAWVGGKPLANTSG